MAKTIDWEKVRASLEETKATYLELPIASTWFVLKQLKQLEDRLASGERTEQLAEQIKAMADL